MATREDEVGKLEAIAANAALNGVDDLRRLTADDVRALEPQVACVAAYLSPSTGIIDSHGLMQALEGHIAASGGEVVLNTSVTGISRSADAFAIETQSGGERSVLTARQLVLAAGLGATTLGRMLDYRTGYVVPVTYPARGHYFALDGKVPFRHLVYPMPTGAWLGVHLTLDVAGRARFGPDIEWRDSVDYAFDDDGGTQARALRGRDPSILARAARRRAACRQRRRAPQDLPRGRADRRLCHSRRGAARHPAPRCALRHGKPRAHVLARHR